MASYKDYMDAAYNAQIQQYDAQKTAQEQQLANAKKIAADTQKETNRGLYQSYMQQRNPFGSNANQRGLGGTKMSEYGMNQAYATYLNGLGTAQQAYDNSINEANNVWNTFLTQDTANRAQAEYQRQMQLADKYASDIGGGSGGGRSYRRASTDDGTLLTNQNLEYPLGSSGITNERQYYAANGSNYLKTGNTTRTSTRNKRPSSSTNRLNGGKAYTTSKSRWG